MHWKKSNLTQALQSDIGKKMYSSVPILILNLSIILFIQTGIFVLYEYSGKGLLPLVISLSSAVFYFLIYIIMKKGTNERLYSLLTFIYLLLFYFIELQFFLVFNIKYLWVLLILTQVLCGYYLLLNRYFLTMVGVQVIVYTAYFIIHLLNDFDMESFLVIISVFLLSFLIHGDRRKTLMSLEKIYNSQKEISTRFIQLEENISQVFIITTADFGHFIYISSAFERLLSISRNELVKKPDMWREFIHPGDKARVALEIEGARIEQTYREFDFRLIHNTETLWLKFQIFPIETRKNKVVDRFAIIVDNITGYKNSELKLAEAKSLDAEFAARIQKNLLFSNPNLNIPELDIAAESIPSLDVGGDFFDFYCFSDSIVDIIIADVMGKGMIASMLGAASKSTFMKSRLDLTVSENEIPVIEKIMTLTNRNLSPELILLGKFITMQYSRINLKSELFSFIDSGHTSILYYSARHKCSWSLKGWNMPLGFNPDELMVESTIPFSNKDLFFFYSDGVTEAENDEGEQFGERRLTYVINNSSHLTSSQIMNKVRNLVFHYSRADGFADDVTCIAMKINQSQDDLTIVEGIFPGRRQSLQIIRTFSTVFLNDNFNDLDDDVKNSIILAVNEAVANVIEHNYEKDPLLEGHEILIEAGRKKNACFFKIYYDGEDFEWTTVKAPDLSELKSGGYGLLLMKEIMDSLCYSTNIDGVQCLTLVKKI